MSSRYDNMITYKSPTFGGVTVYAQASLKQDSSKDGDEASSKADRYYALGATGKWGALSTGAVTFMTMVIQTTGIAGRFDGDTKLENC